MSKKALSTLIAALFATAPAFGQTDDDPMRVQGTSTLGGIHNNTSATDRAQLDQYQDLGNGVMSNVGVRGRNSSTWFQGYGENFGRDDQYMFLRGGVYDVFKAGVYLNDIPHTFSSLAYTPFVGSGGNLLTATFPLPTLATTPPTVGWNSFRLGYDRRDVGGYAEWQRNSPWYFRADASQVNFSGTRPGSGANGTSPGNGFTDLAIPQDFRTSNWGVEGGYQSSKMTFAARWDYSKFDNANETLKWTNPFLVGGTPATSNLLDTTYLAPGNTFNKFTLSGSYRDLPWQSVVSARYTWAKTTSDTPIGLIALNSGGVYNNTLPDTNTFNGENVNQSFQLSWTAMPATNFNTRVFYYWTKLDNKSDLVQFGNAPTTPLASGLGCGNLVANGIPTQIVGNCENELYNYTKNDVGFDAWWKFAPGNRLGFGYDYFHIDQTRVDYDTSHTNKIWAEYKNTMLDTVSARLKYQYLKRESTLNYTNDPLPNGGANNPNYLLPFTSAFDLQSSTSNLVKLTIDWTPTTTTGLSFEANWAKIDYDDVTYGRTKSDRQGYFLSGYWNASDRVKLNAFGSWEDTKYPSNHRYINTVSGGPNPPSGYCTTANPNCYDPFAAPSANNSYNWSSQTRDKTWMVGAGADWQAMDALKLSGSYLYVNNDGTATFGYQAGGITAPPGTLPIPIDNFDNSKQQYFNLKGVWSYNRNWSLTGGYSYLMYKHNDIATDGYTYVLPLTRNATTQGILPSLPTNTSLSYLNGYDAFTNGHSNIFYLNVTYRFDAPPLPAAAMRVAEAPPAPVVRPAPPPPPPPPPAPAPAPQVQKITLDSKVLFDFDKAVLKPEGKAAIDSQIVGKLTQIQKLEVVLVTGHTDRLGTEAHNQPLSLKRADAVRDYLVSKGVPRDKIETIGMGAKQPVPGVVCDQKNRKALIECLAPNRRVDVEVKGESTK